MIGWVILVGTLKLKLQILIGLLKEELVLVKLIP